MSYFITTGSKNQYLEIMRGNPLQLNVSVFGMDGETVSNTIISVYGGGILLNT